MIKHNDALLALNWAFSQRDDLPRLQKKFLGIALDYCLSHNYFWYAGRFFTQKRGVAMGAKSAPSLANLFISEWEDRDNYAKQRSELLFYKRFIDNVFLIWVGTETSLVQFVEDLNQNNNIIKLACHWSSEQINYLDVTVMMSDDGLTTKAFFKPTDRNSYLQIYSGHHGLGTYLKDSSRELEVTVLRTKTL